MALRASFYAILLLLAQDARALEIPASYRYRIEHQIFGDIGWHHMKVRREGDAIVVEHNAELAVRILGLRAFHRRARFHEVWRDQRLIAFEGVVEDNGKPFPVSARAEANYLVVEGRAGRIEAPAETAPSEPSLDFAIERDWYFDSKTGELLRARVTPAGSEPLKVGAAVVEATRYEVTGGLEQHVWFDAGGAWVQWRLWRQGAAITLVREP
jgi:Family of unknown function (DUF6134)